MLPLAANRIRRYIGSVNAQLESELTRALRQWQLRQKSDGSMVSLMALVTLFSVFNFLAFPGGSSAMVMGMFLFALGMACQRLLTSAAKVVAFRKSRNSSFLETLQNSAALEALPRLRPLSLDHWSTGREHLN